MRKYTAYQFDNFEFYVSESNGSVWATEQTLADFCGRTKETISYWLADHDSAAMVARVPKGLTYQTVYLLHETTIVDVIRDLRPRLLEGIRTYLDFREYIHREASPLRY